MMWAFLFYQSFFDNNCVPPKSNELNSASFRKKRKKKKEKKRKKKKRKKKEKSKKKKEKRKEFEGKAVYQSPLPYP